jgi:hypothetical protein
VRISRIRLSDRLLHAHTQGLTEAAASEHPTLRRRTCLKTGGFLWRAWWYDAGEGNAERDRNAGPYGLYALYNNAGTIKIDSQTTDAEVFVNGSYAGTVKDNKTMHLSQGNYNIEIRHAGQTTFSDSGYVTAGKTLHITPAV